MPRLDAPTMLLEFTPAMRTLIEDAIESLILLLDEIDCDGEQEDDPDDEDGGDREPSLGAPERHVAKIAAFGDQRLWAQGESDDREYEDERQMEQGLW
jgi:hypothetical protein